MKKSLLWGAIAALFFASCSKSELNLEPAVEPTADFAATFAQTRTELQGTAVVWNADDELSIFTKTEHNRQYRVKSLSEDGRTATFGFVNYTGTSSNVINANYALYPFNADATISGDVISTVIASEQVYNAEKVDLSYALMVAKSDDNNLAFTNAGALIRFNISKSELLPENYTLSSIKLSSVANNLAGDVTIDLGADCKAVVASTGSKEVVLSAINKQITAEVQPFYVALPATVFADKDLTVTFTFAEGDMSFALPAFELAQGSIKTIAYNISDQEDFVGTTPDNNDDAENSGTSATPANNEIWYTTTNNTAISSFSSIVGQDAVANAYNEKKGCFVATFANDVTYISREAFFMDSSLTSIDLPGSITSIKGNDDEDYSPSFGRNDNLVRFGGPLATEDGLCLILNNQIVAYATGSPATELVIPDGVTKINCDFRDVKNLQSITFPASITDMVHADWRITGLNAIHITDLAAWCNICFSAAKETGLNPGNPLGSNVDLYLNGEKVTDLVIPETVTKISHAAFESGNFNTVTFPEGLTEIGISAFYGCSNLTEVTLPASLTTLYENVFGGCSKLTKVTCKATTPPVAKWVYTNASFWNAIPTNSALAIIYLPSESVSKYNEAKGWSHYEYRSKFVGYVDTSLGSYIPVNYITYAANYNYGSSGDSVYYYRSYITSSTSEISEFHVKVKMNAAESDTKTYFLTSSANKAKESFDGIALSQNGLEFWINNDVGYDVRYTYEELGLTSRNDLIELYVSFVDKKITVNGKELEYKLSDSVTSISSHYLFGHHFRESDDGVYYQDYGFPEGSQLYFAMCWDSSKSLVYLGQASEAVNSYSGNTEYCWKYKTTTSQGNLFASKNDGRISGYTPYGGMIK